MEETMEEAAWNDAVHARGIDVPDEEDEILTAIGAAAQACAGEADLTLAPPLLENGVLRVKLSAGSQTADLAIMVTNKNYHRGAFAAQIETLRGRAQAATATAIAVRTQEFPRGEASEKVILPGAHEVVPDFAPPSDGRLEPTTWARGTSPRERVRGTSAGLRVSRTSRTA
jgi:hypothetical protein